MRNNIYTKETKILIVDDDQAVRDFLKRFLKTKGYLDIQAVKTGEEALKIIEKENINLVLLDVRLPGMDGVEVLRKIKEINKDIGVIMITAFPDEEIGKEAMELGAADYILKPFDLAYLELSVLTKIIAMSK
jgi:two-component system response regulator (stage 0 sporulation protein F)